MNTRKRSKNQYPNCVKIGSRAFLPEDIADAYFTKKEAEIVRKLIKNGVIRGPGRPLVRKKCDCDGGWTIHTSYYHDPSGYLTSTSSKVRCSYCNGHRYYYGFTLKRGE